MDVRSLSKTQAKVVLTLEAEGLELVTLDGIQKRAGVSPGFSRKLAHDLVRRGWLERVRRGTYLLNPSRNGPDSLPDTDPFRTGSRLVEPYYFGFATAAELHGVFPQASQVYYIVSPARWTPSERFEGKYRGIRVAPARFFGYQPMIRRGVELSVSDRERTLLDSLSRPEFSGGMSGVVQIFASVKPRLNWSRFGAYLDRVGRRSLTHRAGYLAEHVRPSLLPPGSWVRSRLPSGGEPYVPLGPPRVHGRRGKIDARWHVIRNVPDVALFAEGEVR